MSKYVIIDAEALQKRIEELEEAKAASNDARDWSYISGKKAGFEIILSQSTPLIPEIEKSFDAGRISAEVGSDDRDYVNKKQYISNLKLDI